MYSRLLGAIAVGLFIGCGSGEVRERPQDCDSHQYFDEVQERCRTCPALSEPECMPDCGLEVIEDARGCPAVRCEQNC